MKNKVAYTSRTGYMIKGRLLRSAHVGVYNYNWIILYITNYIHIIIPFILFISLVKCCFYNYTHIYLNWLLSWRNENIE